MADLPLLGVPAASPSPPPAPTPPASDGSNRWVLVVTCGVALALLAWRCYQLSPSSARPLEIREGAVALSPINLNHANEAELATVPGLGPTLAGRVVLYREEHGEFASVDDLGRVKGIGPKLLERARHFLYVGTYTEAAPPAMNVPSPAQGRKPPPAGKVDINRAPAEELQKLPGIGATLSARILEERARKPFGDADDLRRVKGVGAKTIEKLRPHVTAGP